MQTCGDDATKGAFSPSGRVRGLFETVTVDLCCGTIGLTSYTPGNSTRINRAAPAVVLSRGYT